MDAGSGSRFQKETYQWCKHRHDISDYRRSHVSSSDNSKPEPESGPAESQAQKKLYTQMGFPKNKRDIFGGDPSVIAIEIQTFGGL